MVMPKDNLTDIHTFISVEHEGIGLAALPQDTVAPLIGEGQLVAVLVDWTPKRRGYHLYYPSHKQPSPAFSIVLDALRKYRA